MIFTGLDGSKRVPVSPGTRSAHRPLSARHPGRFAHDGEPLSENRQPLPRSTPTHRTPQRTGRRARRIAGPHGTELDITPFGSDKCHRGCQLYRTIVRKPEIPVFGTFLRRRTATHRNDSHRIEAFIKPYQK